MSENKKVRFTFIDGIIVLVIIAVIAFVGYNFFGKEVVQNQATSDTFEISFYIEEAPDFAAESIEVGSGVATKRTSGLARTNSSTLSEMPAPVSTITTSAYLSNATRRLVKNITCSRFMDASS